MAVKQYLYEVVGVEKITDGDTYWLQLDVGFRQQMLAHIRLFGWDTPELYRGSEFEKERAREARDEALTFFERWLPAHKVWCQTEKDPDSFGRWLGRIFVDDDKLDGVVSLGQELEDMELATTWPTRWRDIYDAE